MLKIAFLEYIIIICSVDYTKLNIHVYDSHIGLVIMNKITRFCIYKSLVIMIHVLMYTLSHMVNINTLKLGCWNVQGLANDKCHDKCLVNFINSHDCTVLLETWLNSNVSFNIKIKILN